jgi:hypothetical protein
MIWGGPCEPVPGGGGTRHSAAGGGLSAAYRVHMHMCICGPAPEEPGAALPQGAARSHRRVPSAWGVLGQPRGAWHLDDLSAACTLSCPGVVTGRDRGLEPLCALQVAALPPELSGVPCLRRCGRAHALLKLRCHQHMRSPPSSPPSATQPPSSPLSATQLPAPVASPTCPATPPPPRLPAGASDHHCGRSRLDAAPPISACAVSQAGQLAAAHSAFRPQCGGHSRWWGE